MSSHVSSASNSASGNPYVDVHGVDADVSSASSSCSSVFGCGSSVISSDAPLVNPSVAGIIAMVGERCIVVLFAEGLKLRVMEVSVWRWMAGISQDNKYGGFEVVKTLNGQMLWSCCLIGTGYYFLRSKIPPTTLPKMSLVLGCHCTVL